MKTAAHGRAVHPYGDLPRGAERCSSSFAIPELHMQLSFWLQTACTLAPQLESRLHGCFLGAVREGRLGGCARGHGFCCSSQELGVGSLDWEAQPALVVSSLVFVGRAAGPADAEPQPIGGGK